MFGEKNRYIRRNNVKARMIILNKMLKTIQEECFRVKQSQTAFYVGNALQELHGLRRAIWRGDNSPKRKINMYAIQTPTGSFVSDRPLTDKKIRSIQKKSVERLLNSLKNSCKK